MTLCVEMIQVACSKCFCHSCIYREMSMLGIGRSQDSVAMVGGEFSWIKRTRSYSHSLLELVEVAPPQAVSSEVSRVQGLGRILASPTNGQVR